MSNRIDLTGQKFGKLTVLSIVSEEERVKGQTRWQCRCDCGKIVNASSDSLRRGNVKSCGCIKIKDIKDKKFGRLTVLAYSHIYNHEAMWECLCDCGNSAIVAYRNLRDGRIVSCGCKHDENIKKLFTKHGLSTTRIYNIWRGMLKRCTKPGNKSYQWSGAKGIKVCKEWQKFEPFYDWAMKNGYGPELSIDRKDNNLDYCPENCQWLTRAENTRKAVTKTKIKSNIGGSDAF
jgi:hypothetical protein